jgi:hypothetical protein
MKTTTEIRTEKNMTFLKSNREAIIERINDELYGRDFTQKEVMQVLVEMCSGWNNNFHPNWISELVSDAFATCQINVNDKKYGVVHSQDLYRAAARRQGANL